MAMEINHLQTSEAKIDLSHQKDYFAEWQMAELKASKSEKENRRLRRALYKACANWAHHRVFVRFKTNEKAWENVERKCLKKAEGYK